MVSEKENNFAYVRCYLAVLRILVAISALLAMRSVFRCSMFTTLQLAVSEQNCPVNGYSDKTRRFMLKSMPQSNQVGLAAFLVGHLQDAGVIRA